MDDPFGTLPLEEQALRRDLQAHAKADRWEEFDKTRLILWDWLYDRGREREAILTRPAWYKMQGKDKIQTWVLPLPREIDWDNAPHRLTMLSETTNSCWILHFPPESLKCQLLPPGRESRQKIRFTWYYNRSSVRPYDLGAHLEGFAYLLTYDPAERV